MITQPESTHCHKHNEFIRESTEGAQGAHWFLTNPHHLRPARPPHHPLLPCCSAPASAQPSSSGKGFPESFLSCSFTQGTPKQPATSAGGGLQGRASAQPGAWGSDQPTAENHSGAPTSFLRGQSRLKSGHSHMELARPDRLPFQVS